MKQKEDTIIFAVAPQNKCVGIRVFLEPFQSENMFGAYENYVKRSVASAFELKSFVEKGIIDNNNRIIQNPPTKYVSREFLIQSHLKRMYYIKKIKSMKLYILNV